MTKSQRFKTLKAHQWIEEEAACSLLILEITKACYLESFEHYNHKKDLFSICIYFLENNYGFEWVRADETKRTFSWALQKWEKDRSFFEKKDEEFERVCRKVKTIFLAVEKGIENYSLESFKELARLVFNVWKEQYSYSVVVEGPDGLTEADYLAFLPKSVGRKFPEVIQVLTTSEELSFIEKEKLSLLKITAKAMSGRIFKKDIAVHTQNYLWIQNSFLVATYLNKKYFLQQIKELMQFKSVGALKKEMRKLREKHILLRKERNKIYRKYRLSQKTKLFFQFLRYLSILQDKRKENVQRLVFCIDQTLQEIEKRFKVKKADLENYFSDEIIKLLEAGRKVSRNALGKRKKVAFFSYIEKNQTKTDRLVGEEADEIINFFKKRKKDLASGKVIQGFVASVGRGKKVIEGRVRIVFEPGKNTFKKGEILVTGMTRPEFVPLMKKAKAIITNEGGITTHAAIISRELKVPCIIGTKIATIVLKTSDCVQLDLEKGTVKILNERKATNH